VEKKSKEFINKRIKESERLAKFIKEIELEPEEIVRMLMGMSLGLINATESPCKATSFIFKCMSEFFSYMDGMPVPDIVSKEKDVQENKEEKNNAHNS
jgi:hypothetical protein